jgi:hypothetical protein
MFLLILVGYMSRKFNIVDDAFASSLSKFIFNFVFSAIVITSMYIPFEQSEVKNSISLVIISTVTMAVFFLLAKLISVITRKNDALSHVMTFAMLFPNFTFMAFPVMETLFPERGLFYITMYTIPTRLVIYILGPLIIKPRGEKLPTKDLIRESLKAIMTPPVLAIPVGLAIYFTGLHLPVAISDTIGYLSKTATPMGMVLTGVMLAQAPLRKMFGERRMYLLTVIRLMILPVITFFALLPFNLDPVVFKIAVLYTALPAASSTTVFAIQYRSDADGAAASVFMTTALSILSVPLWAMFLEYFL